MRIIALFIIAIFPIICFAQGPTIEQKDIIVARQNFRVGTDTSRYFTSITNLLSAGSTHRQLPSAKSVWDALSAIPTTVSTNSTLTGNGSSGSPLGIAQQAATSGQVLKWNGTTWAPAPDGGTTYTGSTGINVTGTVITNTAPDQTVNLTGGGITAISGTYPNFTITSTEVDGSTSNELQNLSLAGQALGISSGTGVTLPVVGVSAGTGISVTSASGVFTVTNTGDTNSADDLTGSGTANRVAFWSGTSALSSNASLFWDNSNGRLGVGATSPSHRLHVVGTGSTSATYTAQFHNSTGTNNALLIRDDGRISSRTTSANAYLNLEFDGGEGASKVIELTSGGGWRPRWLKSYNSLTYARRGVLFGGENTDGSLIDNVLVINTLPIGRVAINKNPLTSSLDYSFEVASGSDTDGIVVTRSDDVTDVAMFHTNSEGDGLLRTKSGFWTLGDIDVSAAAQNPSAQLHLYSAENYSTGAKPLFRVTSSNGYGDFLLSQSYTSGAGSKQIHIGDGTNRVITIKSDNGLSNTWVGIGTDDPQRKFHVAGEVRITDLTTDAATRFVGADADGDLNEITLGSGVTLSSGALVAQNIYNSSGSLTATRTVTTANNQLIISAVTGTGIPAPLAIRGKVAATAAYEPITFAGYNGTALSYFQVDTSTTKFATVSGRKYEVAVGSTYSWKYLESGAFTMPALSVNPTLGTGTEGAFFYNNTAKALYFNTSNSGSSLYQIPSLTKDFIGANGALSSGSTYTVGTGTDLSVQLDAVSNAITVTAGDDMREGVVYRLKGRRNNTNAITINAGGGYSFVTDGDSSLAPTTYTLGAYKTVTLVRIGSIIWIDE